mmetsp:Transcript_13837/g.27323  ORF Transcript_13837/g.27323 Transcript_13837/m.27323 type:complete len:93 (-) Transcript_13837:362-640(-)
MQLLIAYSFFSAIDFNCLTGKHFKRAEHANIFWAILHIECLYRTVGNLAVEVDPKPLRKKNAIRVHLDNPVVAPVPTVNYDQVPSPDEIVSV